MTWAAILLTAFVICLMTVPNFFQFQNLVNLVTNNWAVIAVGVGVTFLLVSGNFDLSVGGIVAMSGDSGRSTIIAGTRARILRTRMSSTRNPASWQAARARAKVS